MLRRVQHLQARTVVHYLLVPEAFYKRNWLGGIQHRLTSIVYLILKVLPKYLPPFTADLGCYQ